MGSTFSISANLVDVESGELVSSSRRSVTGTLDDLVKFIRVVAYDLLGFIEISDLIERRTSEFIEFNKLGYSYQGSEKFYGAILAFREAEQLKPGDIYVI